MLGFDEHQLERSTAELASAGVSGQLRARIRETFVRWSGCSDFVFLERTGHGFYLAHQAAASFESGVDPQGPLVRWLRVNNEMVVFEQRPDVWNYLAPEDREFLENTQGHACVPLVSEDALVAFLILCGIPDAAALLQRKPLLEAYAARAAEHWLAVTRAEQLQAKQNALGLSHRLGMAGQIAASVAHEVRNPLAAIRSLVQFAHETELSDTERGSMLRDVLEEVDRIDHTVTGMLELSQPPSPEHRQVDLLELVKSTTRFVRAYGRRRGIQLAAVGNGPSTFVIGDARELRQVITNLLLNACQACDSGDQVEASVRWDPHGSGQGRFAIVEIRDSGAGIAAEHLPRLFEPFFTTKPQGTGLGLAFCKDVVQRHGGTVQITSALGTGTSVVIQLPIVECE